MMAAAGPGASHGDVVAAGMALLAPAGAALANSFMASGRGGENPQMVRRNFPAWRSDQRLADRQWFRIGLSGVVEGYYFDLSRSSWDAPWLAPGDATVIEPGMVLCIERAIRRDGHLGDFEETVVVTADGCEKITDARIRYW